ncbi:MAG: DUF1385 domain-containing protein [bacterium]|nr:DUF1385 domain-containing protein [bacterium]
MKPSGIGGQAVIEGVMMRNKDVYAVAVRKPNEEIEVVNHDCNSLTQKSKFFGLPIVRGVVSFVESLVIGTKIITYSASFYDDEEAMSEKEKLKAKQKEEKKAVKAAKRAASGKPPKEEKEKSDTLFMAFTITLSILLAIGIFILLPMGLSVLLGRVVKSSFVLGIIEGILRLVIFMAYILLISQMEDIQRVFMYHGAEHKTINCIENGYDLTVENVRVQSREHKRCGTSFLLFVIIISSIFFIFIRVDNIMLKTVIRLLLVPVIAGVSYEVIRLAGRSESKFVAAISRPGMWLQGMTTREPDDSMIEVAIASVEAVFDWRGFLGKDKE